jgi:quercetin dioxygenase-like cupin family protein
MGAETKRTTIHNLLLTMQNENHTPSSDLTSVPVTTVDFVNYQDGSIVSRELIKKSTGTVSAFAFDKGEGLSEHTAPFDALVQVLEGEAEITVAGKPHHVLGGQMILMPANRPHALRALTRFKMLLTMIRS